MKWISSFNFTFPCFFTIANRKKDSGLFYSNKFFLIYLLLKKKFFNFWFVNPRFKKNILGYFRIDMAKNLKNYLFYMHIELIKTSIIFSNLAQTDSDRQQTRPYVQNLVPVQVRFSGAIRYLPVHIDSLMVRDVCEKLKK